EEDDDDDDKDGDESDDDNDDDEEEIAKIYVHKESDDEETREEEKEEADELYRDVDINQGKGLQISLDIEDSHVTLTLVKPDGQQESSSMNEAVRVAVQIQTDQLRDSYQRENDKFLRTIDDNIKRIIKEQ
nr:hypothetical protein [Tanacetum cinerariifolium]